MTKIYVIEGSCGYKRWPVCWRLDELDARTALKACTVDQVNLRERFAPLHGQLDRLISLFGTRRGKENASRRISQEFVAARDRIFRRRDEIIIEWLANAFDPLAPALFYDIPDTKYRIVEVLDDPREIGKAGLIRLRAMLHSDDEDEVEDVADLDV